MFEESSPRRFSSLAPYRLPRALHHLIDHRIEVGRGQEGHQVGEGFVEPRIFGVQIHRRLSDDPVDDQMTDLVRNDVEIAREGVGRPIWAQVPAKLQPAPAHLAIVVRLAEQPDLEHAPPEMPGHGAAEIALPDVECQAHTGIGMRLVEARVARLQMGEAAVRPRLGGGRHRAAPRRQRGAPGRQRGAPGRVAQHQLAIGPVLALGLDHAHPCVVRTFPERAGGR